jgi:anaerobic ribonucleoside-triphosphate reductase activating protein
LTVEEMADNVRANDGIEGVTYVGGEPFAQAQALARLSAKLRAANLTIMTYTGFTLKELKSGRVPYAEDLLNETDLLLDGPYRSDLPSNRLWRGSDNQRLVSLSKRYNEKVAEWNEPKGQQFEIRFREDGSLEILGIPPAELTGTAAAPPGEDQGVSAKRNIAEGIRNINLPEHAESYGDQP